MSDDPSSPQARPRPAIADILTAEAIRSVASGAGMTEMEIAEAMAPDGLLSPTAFYLAMKSGEALARTFGLRCRRTVELSLRCSYATAVRSLFFTLSDLRYGPVEAVDTADGSRLNARLPADQLSFSGSLDFEILDHGDRIDIVGTSVIGQLIDWGKGKATLRDIFARTQALASRIEGRS